MWDILGIDELAVAVYLQLVRDPDSSRRELADSIGVSVRRLPGLLAELESRGLLTMTSRNEVRVVRPDVGLEALLSAVQADLAERSGLLAEARAAVQSLTETYLYSQRRRGAAEFEVVTGLRAIQERLIELARVVKNEALRADPHADLRVEATRAMDHANIEMFERGVRLRSIFPHSLADHPDAWTWAQEASRYGDEIRTCAVIPMLFNIADRSLAIVPLDPEDTQRGALFVRSPALVAGLLFLFELLWATATPLGAPALPERPDLSATDYQLLELLARGSKDELAAHSLGLSVRTVRARAQRLMRLTGSRSRLQLGVEAAKRGWL